MAYWLRTTPYVRVVWLPVERVAFFAAWHVFYPAWFNVAWYRDRFLRWVMEP